MNTQDLLLLAEARKAAESGEGLALRRAAQLSQSELGSVIDVAPPTLSRWEAGQRSPHGPGAIRWARLLQTLRRQGGDANEDAAATEIAGSKSSTDSETTVPTA